MARYKNNETTDPSSDDPILTAVQSKMARVGLNLGIRDVAKLAGVSTNTLHRLESGERLQSRTLAAIRDAYERAGASFLTSADQKKGVLIIEESL